MAHHQRKRCVPLWTPPSPQCRQQKWGACLATPKPSLAAPTPFLAAPISPRPISLIGLMSLIFWVTQGAYLMPDRRTTPSRLSPPQTPSLATPKPSLSTPRGKIFLVFLEECQRINDILWREILAYMAATPPATAKDCEGEEKT